MLINGPMSSGDSVSIIFRVNMKVMRGSDLDKTNKTIIQDTVDCDGGKMKVKLCE